MTVKKINRIVLTNDVLSDLDAKATKTELQNIKTELQNEISSVVTNLLLKPSVATFDDIATTYPTPVEGWSVTVDDTNITYTYDADASVWNKTSINAIPQVSSTLNGLMIKEDKVKLDTIFEGAQPNKTPQQVFDDIKALDGAGSGLEADTLQGKVPTDFAVVNHDHDGRYYTKTQNDVAIGGKQDKLGFTPENLAKKGVADGYCDLDVDAKIPDARISDTFVTQSQLGTAGYGDMTKAVYDPEGDGKVVSAINADVVPWTGVSDKPLTFPPSAHTHGVATTSADGFMSSSDKTKLDGLNQVVSTVAPASPPTNMVWIDLN
jgi:hypothetical protein